MLKGEYVDFPLVNAKILHLNNELEATYPLISVLFARTGHDFQWIILYLNTEAVLEAWVSFI